MGQGFVVAKGTGGLGNRLLSVVTAILYARICGRRLIIDWTDGTYSPRGLNAFPRYFDCPQALGMDALPDTRSIYPEIWRGCMGNSLADLRDDNDKTRIRHLTIDVARTDYPQDIVVFSSYHQETHRMTHLFKDEFSYLRSMSIGERVAKVMIEDMPLKRTIKGAVDSFASQYFENDNIGVHVRYTDYKVDLDYIYRKADRLAKRRSRPQFFLATDSSFVESDFRRRYDNVLTTDKWFPQSGWRLHRNPRECPDLHQNGVEALIDLYLLSRCSSMIYSSRSTFGSLATWMNPDARHRDIDRRRIIQTKQWIWQLLVDSRPTRQRYGLTKSAIKGLFLSAKPADNEPR